MTSFKAVVSCYHWASKPIFVLGIVTPPYISRISECSPIFIPTAKF
ncbi:hypothetical protein P20495_1636 [Pseudoalteromonas sp. BSi20495]|nr:hypothetical protein P20495_1636 [Pseudoalteromonas sp. BSi20495]